ncbi:MAG: hypothetical protein U5J83_18000 [Bryobacterales bacterium]|nr:hypothetical protein [Bryobacterales bacterium]
MKTTLLSLIVAALLLVIPAPANTDVVMFPAELSVSFEAVQGRVVLAGDQVLFWSDSATYPSFYFHKAIVGRSGIANNVLTVETQEPIRIQDGSRSRFDFRMTGTADASSIERWFAQPAGVMAGPSGSTSTAAPPERQG